MIIQELKDALVALGLQPKQLVCVYSDLTRFAIPKELSKHMRIKGVHALVESYLETLLSVLGKEGTLCFPTYTYSACKGEVFDPECSPSTVGVLSEHFRRFPGTFRSDHPIFSHCALGPKAKSLLEVSNYDSFGENSFFAKFEQMGGSYLLLGTTLENSATFMYRVLQTGKYSERFIKNFPGKIRVNNSVREQSIPYFVRNLENPPEEKWEWLVPLAVQNGTIKEVKYQGSSLLLVNGSAFHNFALSEITNAPERFFERKT